MTSLCASKLLLVTGAACLFACSAIAQEPDLKQSPPAIEFAPWKQVDEDPRTHEFSAVFPSAITTAHPVNNVVPLEIFLPARRAGPVPVVLVLHYWGANDLRVERNIAYGLTAKGIGAVLLTLPYHIARTPQGSRSGAMAIEPDPEKLKATMLQCVLDVRRTIDFVLSHPEFDLTRIGIAGTSLGAIVTALVTGIDNRIHSAAYILGGVDLAKVLWRSSRVVTEREDLRQKGYTEEKLRVALAPIEPLNYLKDLKPSRTFVVGGKYDTVIPPDATEKLIDALDNPAVLWLETGHYGGFFVQKRVHREVAQFFSAAFDGKPYVPPKRIDAPTIRLGVSLYPDRGLQVAVGIDFWKGDKAGNTFASMQFAPRGIQAFLGRRLDRGLALGVFARRGGIAPGAFWSIVL